MSSIIIMRKKTTMSKSFKLYAYVNILKPQRINSGSKMLNRASQWPVMWSVWQFSTRYYRFVSSQSYIRSLDGIQHDRRATEAGIRWQVGRAECQINGWPLPLRWSQKYCPDCTSAPVTIQRKTHFYLVKPSPRLWTSWSKNYYKF